MKTNRAPFTDLCILIAAKKDEDASGHYTVDPVGREIFCSVCDGVARAEFYEGYKAGVRLSIVVEVWQDDYMGERILCYEGDLYNIIRTYPTGRGTLELSCTEVER